MSQENQNPTENKRINKENIFDMFVHWYAIPPIERRKTGVEDQNDFAKKVKVNKDTLTRWKQRPDFKIRVKEVRQEWGHDKLPDIVHAIYVSAVNGNASSQKLWMNYFSDLTDRLKDNKNEKPTPRPLSVNDVLSFISILPEDKKEKYFKSMRELLQDSMEVEKENTGKDGNFDEYLSLPNINYTKPRYIIVDTHDDPSYIAEHGHDEDSDFRTLEEGKRPLSDFIV